MIARFKNSGFSLVEMVVYVTLLTLILLALVNIVFSFTKSYEQLGALRAAENTGMNAMERMVRDIHAASSIDVGDSTLSTSPGVLTLLIGASTTEFYTSNGEIRVKVDGTDIGPLSVSSAKITSLIFRQIATSTAQAVKIDMTVQGTVGSSVKTKTYHATAILKNS